MVNFVAVGDSLTAQEGYINYLQQKYQVPILNLAVSGGSNHITYARLRNLIFTGSIGPQTTILWQAGSFVRPAVVLDSRAGRKFCHGEPGIGAFDWFPCELDLYQETTEKVFLLGHNDYFRADSILDVESSVQQLASEIYLWSRVVRKIIVFVGLAPDCDRDHLLLINRFLDQSPNIETVPPDFSIVNWCRNHGQKMADSGHPDRQSYIAWCQNVLESRFAAALLDRE